MHFLILPFVVIGLAAKVKNKKYFKTFPLLNRNIQETKIKSNHKTIECPSRGNFSNVHCKPQSKQKAESSK